MSVTALSARAGRHTSQPSGPGRVATATRRAPGTPAVSAPALTVTLAIGLTGDVMTPQAHRLLEVVRELVELGQGVVTVDGAPEAQAPPRGEAPRRSGSGRPATTSTTGRASRSAVRRTRPRCVCSPRHGRFCSVACRCR